MFDLRVQLWFVTTLVAASQSLVFAFSTRPAFCRSCPSKRRNTPSLLLAEASPSIRSLSEEENAEPLAFIDSVQTSYIEVFPDTEIVLDGIKYTIGIPCDQAVAIGYISETEEGLVPLELNDNELMEQVFPICQSIVEDEFGDELSLERTPQTLTLVGELEEDDDEDEFDMDDDEDDDDYQGDEVQVLLSFEVEGKEYHLVKIIDPVILVGKEVDGRPEVRFLLSEEESIQVLPTIERMILEHEGVLEE